MIPLANHLWQSTAFAAAVWVMALVLRKNRAAARCSLWVAASIKFAIPFSLLVSAGSRIEWRRVVDVPAPAPIVARLAAAAAPFRVELPDAPPIVQRNSADGWQPVLAAVWLVGVGAGVFTWARQWRRARRAATSGRELPLGLPVRAVSIRESWAPGVFGFVRPVLLLPERIGERLTAAELDAIVAHELCHVRRRDNLWAAIQTAVQTVFWFYPPVWWIGRRLLEERERACDEAVAETAEPRTYAEGIVRVCQWYLESAPACVAGAGGARLRERVVAIVRHRPAPELGVWKRSLVAATGLVALAAPFAVGLAQGPAGGRPKFEVASVLRFRPGSAPEGRKIMPAHGSVTVRQETVRDILRWAYGLSRADYIEGPGWIDSEEYDITAKAAADVPEDQLRLMMQDLLADRFHLEVRQRTEVRPRYELVMAKGGPRMKKVDRPSERGMYLRMEGRLMNYEMVADMPRLVEALAMHLDRPVVDQTGLAGVYEVRLQVEMNPEAMMPQVGQRFNGFGLTAGVFGAVDALGLKLVGGKGPAQILTIDRIERPSAN